jgi:DNA-binding NtrC family response regulator
MAKRGEFREDLLYRLNVIAIRLPPLRERREDLPILLNHYIDSFAEENELPPIDLTEGAIKVLRDYCWPGNIRELRNFCENTVVLKRGSELSEYDLDPKYQNQTETSLGDKPQPLSSDPTLCKEENEKRLLRNALIKANGNRTHAAELMGISRRTLHRKLIQWPELNIQK